MIEEKTRLQSDIQLPIFSDNRLLVAVDRFLGIIIEIVAAALVLIETGILFAGVVARYLLRSPLIWSDELASILFLWLAMLGAGIALRRNEHMRMSAIAKTLPPTARNFCETISVVVPFVFLVVMLPPGIQYFRDETFVSTPALGISGGWAGAAFPVGTALMLLSGLVRLLREANWKIIITTALLVVVIAAVFFAAEPALKTLGKINLVIFFVGLVGVLVFAGVPIAFSFGLASFAYLAFATETPTLVLVGRINEGMSQLILLAVPLFVLLGQLMEMTGLARAIVAFLVLVLGRVRGGLYYALVGAMYLVSGISGSKAADMAAVVPVLLTEMQAQGAAPGELLALLAATGAQTETIPPSLVLITIGSVTGVSIAALFSGGLLPGFLLGLVLCVVVRLRTMREDVVFPTSRISWRASLRILLAALPGLALPFIIRTAVISGVATATEVSTVGIVYTVLVGLLVYRQFNWGRILTMSVETASLSGAILLIIGAATGMSWSLTQSGFSQALADVMGSIPGGKPMFLSVSILAFILLGSVLEGIPAIVLFGPLLFPIARSLGVHEVHYAIVVVLAMGIGLFAPPFGVGYYAACAVSRVPPDAGLKPILPYLLALALGTVLIAAVPWISLSFL